jgi:hypothetical protein
MFLSGPYSKPRNFQCIFISNFRWTSLSIPRVLFSEISAIRCLRCAFASVPVLLSRNASVNVECCTKHCLTIRMVSQTQYNLFLYKWELPSKFPVKCSSHIRNSKSTLTLSVWMCLRPLGRPTTNSSSLQVE